MSDSDTKPSVPNSTTAPTAPTSAAKPRRGRKPWLLLGLLAFVLLSGAAAIFFTVFTPDAPDPFLNLAYLVKDHPVKQMTNAQFETQVAHDMLELNAHRHSLMEINTRLDALAAELPQDAGQLTPEKRRELKNLWITYIDHQLALFQMKEIYKVFPGISRFNAPPNRWRHARTFAIAYYIHLLQVDSSWKFIAAFNGQAHYESILDESDREHGISANVYARMKFQVLHLQTLAEVETMQVHFLTLKPNHYTPYLADSPNAPDAWVPNAVTETMPTVIVRYHTEGRSEFAANAKDLFKEGAFKTWFPVQKQVSEWMGDTSVARRKSLITVEQLAEMRKALQPGDIILERRNWYLSNVGLPGFWPHAELYIGTLDELEAALGGDEGVKAWLKEQGAGSIRELLERKHPDLLKRYLTPQDGHPVRIIESISEGVALSTMEHACLADYVCAMRPRFSAVDRVKSIFRAFNHYAKPYDFDFDFITDDKIVCSELVYKAWRPDEDKAGVRIGLKEVMRRKVLPSNEFIGLFREELAKPDRQLDFVYFLEGIEKDGKARVGTEQELAETYTRPKWDILQE